MDISIYSAIGTILILVDIYFPNLYGIIEKNFAESPMLIMVPYGKFLAKTGDDFIMWAWIANVVCFIVGFAITTISNAPFFYYLGWSIFWLGIVVYSFFPLLGIVLYIISKILKFFEALFRKRPLSGIGLVLTIFDILN